MRASLVRALVVTIALALVVTMLVAIRPLARDSKVCPDFIQFWTAATLLTEGHSPYDAAGQARIQGALGWKTNVDGLGRYAFLPYYYPPWLALACELLLPLGYVRARAAWLAINAAAMLAAAVLLRNSGSMRGFSNVESVLARRSRAGIVIFVTFFAPGVIAVLMGQVSPLVLVTIAGVWRLLERKSDRAAGALLAWLTIKPQLTFILIVALLLWCARRGRWQVAAGFVAALGALVAISTLVTPSWFVQMIEATSATELPSRVFPWTGATAYAIFQVVGVRGVALWIALLAVALPAVTVVGRAALDRGSRLEEVLGPSLLAPFFVATYARHYDFPVLLVPALILLSRETRRFGAGLFVTLLVLPYVHLAAFSQVAAWCQLPLFPGPQVTFFWIPLLIALAWLAQTRRMRREALRQDVFQVS